MKVQLQALMECQLQKDENSLQEDKEYIPYTFDAPDFSHLEK